MAVQAAVNGDNLAREISAFVRTQIHAHIGNVLRAAIAGYHDVVEEDVLENLWNFSFVFRCNDKTRAYAVAADTHLAVLKSSRLCEHVNTGFCSGISC